jgi:Domain of unknown function (DUF222)
MPSSYTPPDLVRDQVRAELDAVDAAYQRLRELNTDLVGQGFRVEVAERLEAQHRGNRGLMLRTFGELGDPPDGVEDAALPAGVKLRDVLGARLRITTGEVTRRMRVAARVRPRRSLTGPPAPPEFPVLALAVADGTLGEDHLTEICKALDALPHAVSHTDRDHAEQILVAHAAHYDKAFLTQLGRALADRLNPDGHVDDADRAARRGLTLGPQRPDGMSRLSGMLTPKARALFEAIAAAVRPGHHVPDTTQTVVTAATDTRTNAQRCHDAVECALDTALSSGALGQHRGLPVTVIATTTLAELEHAAAAVSDPRIAMPPPARTGGGSRLPMRDLIAMAARGAIHYLAVFDNHSNRPLYLGRSQRLASPDQRILCYARDRGCTHCSAPGYHCEVHHATDWHPAGATDADNLFFACAPANQAAANGHYSTTIINGRLAWTNGTDPPRINPLHHPEDLLAEKDFEDEYRDPDA